MSGKLASGEKILYKYPNILETIITKRAQLGKIILDAKLFKIFINIDIALILINSKT